MKKLKVLLIQLPIPKNSLLNTRFNHFNVPMAAGYLKAMAHKHNLLKEVDIEILNSKDQDLSGDKRLIDIILAKKPDILGMTLYAWNSTRSLYAAGEIKNILHDIKIIIGGPDVHPDEPEILNNPAVDICVIGEGELTFCELLKHFLYKSISLDEISGIAFKKNNQLKATPTRPIIEDLNQIPSPYLLGFLNPKEYGGLMLIETQRGCPFQCKYCRSWAATGIRSVPVSLERTEEEIKLGKTYAATVFFLDANFNLHKDFKRICKFISQIDPDKNIKWHMFLKTDKISAEDVELLAEVNAITHLGLQTTNEKTKSIINLKNDHNKSFHVVSQLVEKGVECGIELMLGLPEETLDSYKQTINLLEKNKFIADKNSPQKICDTVCSPLSIFPGTRLRKEAAELKLKFQPHPSYRILETPTMSFQQMKEAVDCSKDRVTFDSYSRFFSPVYLTTYFNGLYPENSNVNDNVGRCNRANKEVSVTKIILDLKSLDCISSEQIQEIANNLANVVTTWFISDNLLEDKEKIKRFLYNISLTNPYIIWNIFIETSSAFPVAILQEIKESVQYLINALDYEAIYYFDIDSSCPEYYRFATQLSVILQAEHDYDQNWLDELSVKYPMYWSVFLDGLSGDKLPENLSRKANGILLDFSPHVDISFILNVLKYLSENNLSQSIVFKNWVIQRIWDFEYRKYIDKLNTEEHIIKMSGNQSETLVFEENKLLEQLRSWVENRKLKIKA